MPANTLSAQRRRLAAQALLATRDRLAADAALLATASVPTLEVPTVTMTTPTTAPSATDLVARLQSLLDGLTPAATPAPVAAAAPAPAPAPSGLAKAQAFWQSDYEGKGVPARQLSNGRWVDAKGAFCKGPKVGKTQRPVTAADVAPVVAAPKGPGISLEQLDALLAALGGAAAVAPAAAPATPALRKDGSWMRCGLCEEAYWSASNPELAAKYAKHLARKHAGK
jgi:hypothetical protein